MVIASQFTAPETQSNGMQVGMWYIKHKNPPTQTYFVLSELHLFPLQHNKKTRFASNIYLISLQRLVS